MTGTQKRRAYSTRVYIRTFAAAAAVVSAVLFFTGSTEGGLSIGALAATALAYVTRGPGMKIEE